MKIKFHIVIYYGVDHNAGVATMPIDYFLTEDWVACFDADEEKVRLERIEALNKKLSNTREKQIMSIKNEAEKLGYDLVPRASS